MREPGFNGEIAPGAANSLQWITERIVADPRFADATVQYWWWEILGDDVVPPPEDPSDINFAGQLLASQAQAAEVSRLGAVCRKGIAGVKPFNGNGLLAEIALSPWIRAETVTVVDPVRAAALCHAGVKRILTPEELARLTEANTGCVWGRRPRQWLGGAHFNLNAVDRA